MNKLESLQQKTVGIQFIKSYPILNKVFTQSTDKQIIELILSYQDNGQDFYMNYKDISNLLNIKYQTVKNTVCKLKKDETIITNHKKNFNGKTGGSSTTLIVNIDKIINIISEKTSVESSSNITNITSEVVTEIVEDVLEEKPTPTEEISFEEFSILQNATKIKMSGEETKDYSNIEFKLTNGKVVFILNSCLDYWIAKEGHNGLIKRFKQLPSQSLFDITIKDKNEEWLTTKDDLLFAQ